MVKSRCGIVCEPAMCKEAWKVDCPGCALMDKPFWGECDVKICCESKNLEHCGLCVDFPCDVLNKYSYSGDEHADNGARIEQCKKWADTPSNAHIDMKEKFLDNWVVIESKYVYESPFGSMRLDTCRLPDGIIIKEYNVCEYPDWVDIVAVNDNNELVMVKQYRHGAGKIFLEVVAGTVEDGEAPEKAIIRELQEETGYVCLSEPILLGRFHHNPARQNNILHIYFCDKISKKHEQDLDDIEDIEIIHVPFDNVEELINDGTITQLSSVSAISLAKKYLQNQKALNIS